jgi:DNA polymerase-3 subunit gamma/tau
MPDPGALAKKLEERAARPAPPVGEAPASAAADAPPWEALVEQVERAGEMMLGSRMRMQVRVVELSFGVLRYAQPPGVGEDLAAELRAGLLKATGQRWRVERCEEQGLPTLVEQAEASRASADAALRRAPLVEAAFAAFPGAEFVSEDEGAPPGRGGRNWSRSR